MSALVVVLALALSAVLTRLMMRPRIAAVIVDRPNARSLHRMPTPRGGGIAIVTSVAIATLCASGLGLLAEGNVPAATIDGRLAGGIGPWVAAGAAALGLVSLRDDISDVPVAVRMAVHLGVAVAVTLAGLALPVIELPGVQLGLGPAFAVVFTVLFIVWYVNLYNFMDGMDGFAGGMTIFGFGTLAALGLVRDAPTFALLCGVVAAAAGGFLAFNFPPARIFMGDVGSSVLGFLAATASLYAAHAGIAPLWVSVLVFSPFVVDATVTLLLRVARRERVWEGHKTHHYQRLVEAGWGHRRTVLAEYALMSTCSVSALASLAMSDLGRWILLFAWVAVYIIGMMLVRRTETSLG